MIGILHLIRSLTWELEDVANLLDNFCRGILRPFLDELGFRSQTNETGPDHRIVLYTQRVPYSTELLICVFYRDAFVMVGLKFDFPILNFSDFLK